MPGSVQQITSSSHFTQLTRSHTYTIVDFYADWCGPCKVISPVFESLATQHAAQGRLAFCKVNVDSQRDVASQFGISAMPTFLILKGSSVQETIRGANATALRNAVQNIAGSAAKSNSAAFTGAGQKLGGGGGGGGSTGTARAGGSSAAAAGLVLPDFGLLLSSPAAYAQRGGPLSTVVRFLGLYFTTLFSLEPDVAAAQSPFSIKDTVQRANVSGPGRRL